MLNNFILNAKKINLHQFIERKTIPNLHQSCEGFCYHSALEAVDYTVLLSGALDLCLSLINLCIIYCCYNLLCFCLWFMFYFDSWLYFFFINFTINKEDLQYTCLDLHPKFYTECRTSDENSRLLLKKIWELIKWKRMPPSVDNQLWALSPRGNLVGPTHIEAPNKFVKRWTVLPISPCTSHAPDHVFDHLSYLGTLCKFGLLMYFCLASVVFSYVNAHFVTLERLHLFPKMKFHL